jgi:hypothetical protein
VFSPELTIHAINLKEKIYIDIAMLAAAVIAQIYVLKGYLLLAMKLAQRPDGKPLTSFLVSENCQSR